MFDEKNLIKSIKAVSIIQYEELTRLIVEKDKIIENINEIKNLVDRLYSNLNALKLLGVQKIEN